MAALADTLGKPQSELPQSSIDQSNDSDDRDSHSERMTSEITSGITSNKIRSKITLLQIFPTQKDLVPNPRRLVSYSESLSRYATVPVETVALCAKNVTEGIIDLALNQPCDVIILGASRKGILEQPLTGDITAEIMRQCDCTVIIVQKAMTKNN